MPRRTETFAIYCGRFASQQLAFAHLLDTCDRTGINLNFDHVEIIARETAGKRLAAHFAPDSVTRLCALQAETLVLISAEAGEPCPPFGDTEHLRLAGTETGWVTRAATES